MTMKLDIPEMQALCTEYAPLLQKVPYSIDRVTLLFALSGCESSFGLNCAPRYERAYFEGVYSKSPDQANLNQLYGKAGAMSYGPWQVMLVNALGYTPKELDEDPEKAAEATVAFINRRIYGSHYPPVSLEQFADSYNSGTYRDGNVPTPYIKRFLQFYKMGLPTSEVK